MVSVQEWWESAVRLGEFSFFPTRPLYHASRPVITTTTAIVPMATHGLLMVVCLASSLEIDSLASS